jgi:hypothetical protein
MDFKKLLKEYAEVRIDRNYSKVESFYNHEMSYMSSLRSIRWEILNCLLLENDNASITLTNHFVERMLKLSLIQLETKDINLSEPEKYSKRIIHAHNQYDRLKLNVSIKRNKDKQLISEDEFNYLNTTCKMFRDSYSHAEIGVINKTQPNNFSGFMFSFDDVKQKLIKGEHNFEKKLIEIPKESPSMAQFYQTQSSRENALDYFTNVYQILINIEKKLKEI